MGCFVPFSQMEGRSNPSVTSRCSSLAAACCSLLLLTRAPLITPSHSKTVRSRVPALRAAMRFPETVGREQETLPAENLPEGTDGSRETKQPINALSMR